MDGVRCLIELGCRLVIFVRALIGDALCGILGNLRKTVDIGQMASRIPGIISCVIQTGIDKRIQLIQLGIQVIQCTLRKVHRQIGLHLSDNSADVLSSVNRCPVGVALQKAGVAADNSADVIPHMLVADVRLVRAGGHNAGGKACDSACIRIDFQVLKARKIPGHQNLFQCTRELIQSHIGILIGGIDTVFIGAGEYRSLVVADNSAAGRGSCHRACAAAAKNRAVSSVSADNSADLTVSRNLAVEGAVLNFPVIQSGNSTKLRLISVRCDDSLHLQIRNGTRVLYGSEHAGLRNISCYRNTGKPMSLSVEASAKGLQRCEFLIGKIKIRVQVHFLVSGPAVIVAVLHQLLEILHGIDFHLLIDLCLISGDVRLIRLRIGILFALIRGLRALGLPLCGLHHALVYHVLCLLLQIRHRGCCRAKRYGQGGSSNRARH